MELSFFSSVQIVQNTWHVKMPWYPYCTSYISLHRVMVTRYLLICRRFCAYMVNYTFYSKFLHNFWQFASIFPFMWQYIKLCCIVSLYLWICCLSIDLNCRRGWKGGGGGRWESLIEIMLLILVSLCCWYIFSLRSLLVLDKRHSQPLSQNRPKLLTYSLQFLHNQP